jgi:eukaryotic-like serine/threonine-protein kinase
VIASPAVQEEPVDVAADEPSADEELGSYVVFDEIASGGMATVHLGWLETPSGGRFVAIKRMHEHYARDPDFTSMFLDEVMLCTRIRHPNVVSTIDVAQEDGELELVLELVEGESLSRLTKSLAARKERVPQGIASRIVIDLLHGLHAAHEATNAAGEPLSLVHRDVSPHNLMVGIDGVSKVLDFGVAKASGRMQQTQKGQLKGKLSYMSPEQARGRAVDRRSDVFAAGVVLWELLTGRRLFDGDNEAAILTALLVDEPEPPSTVEPSLASLDALVMRALAVDPEERYPTAQAMAEAVEAAISPSTPAEVGAWVQREARLALAKRSATMRRARARIEAAPNLEAAAQRHHAPGTIPPPAAPRPLHAPSQRPVARAPLAVAPPADEATMILDRPEPSPIDDGELFDAPSTTTAPEQPAAQLAPPPTLTSAPLPPPAEPLEMLPAFAPPPGFGAARPSPPLEASQSSPSWAGPAMSPGPAPSSAGPRPSLASSAPVSERFDAAYDGAPRPMPLARVGAPLPPPLDAEQIRRLQRVGAVAFAVSGCVALLLVLVLGRSAPGAKAVVSPLRPHVSAVSARAGAQSIPGASAPAPGSRPSSPTSATSR